MKFITHSPEETHKLAEKLTKKFKGGQIILLNGNLGAGKTHFAQGVAKALGIKKNITSPTFTLMNIYKIPINRGKKKLKEISNIKQLVHIDLYRLKTAKEAFDIGIMDYIGEPSTLSLIEWPDKIKNELTKKYDCVTVAIKAKQKSERSLFITF